jgi:hypothetical protein
MRHGLTTTAHVAGYRHERDIDSPDVLYYFRVVRFTDQYGTTHETKINPGYRHEKHPPGTEVPLRYLPDNPKVAYRDTLIDIFLIPVVLMILGLSCGVAGWIMVKGAG